MSASNSSVETKQQAKMEMEAMMKLVASEHSQQKRPIYVRYSSTCRHLVHIAVLSGVVQVITLIVLSGRG
jgi:hypothetical protein